MGTSKVNLNKKPIVDLRKDVGRALRKRNLGGLEMDVELIIDRSGSMQDEYESGLVQLVVDRCYALCRELDPDGVMPVTMFHNRAKALVDLTEKNVDNYIRDQLSREAYGGTSYAPPLEMLLARRKCEKGLLGGIKPRPRASLALFITDGVNDDAAQTGYVMKQLSEIAPVFVKFIGLDTGPGTRFPTLEKLDDMSGRSFDNADFFRWDGSVTDDALYDLILNEVAGAMDAMRRLKLLA